MWPRLVPERGCKTPCTVILTDGHGEDGAPREVARVYRNCLWQDSHRQTITADRQIVTVTANILFDGDICPEREILTGTVEALGRVMTIHRGSKCRNPDGTVNYTRLELM